MQESRSLIKIALISYASHLPSLGGGGIHIRELSRALARRGHDVTIVGALRQDLRCRDRWRVDELSGDVEIHNAINAADADILAWRLRDSPPFVSHAEEGVRFLEVCVPREDLSYLVDFVFRSAGPSSHEKSELIDQLSLYVWAEWVGDLLPREGFDICHAHHWRSALYRGSSRLREKAREEWRKVTQDLREGVEPPEKSSMKMKRVYTRYFSNYVFTPHLLDRTIREYQAHDTEELMDVLRSLASSEEEFVGNVQQHVGRFLQLQGALQGHIIAVSRDEQSLLTQWASQWPPGAVTLHSIPSGFDPEIFVPREPGLPEEPIQILSIGRLDPIKRFELAIEILKHLRLRGTQATLRIVGLGRNPGYEEALRAKMNAIGFSGSVVFDLLESPLSSPEVATLLHRTDFYLQTSEYESFGMVVLEAMATGTPVIAVDVGGMGDLIRDVGGGIAIRSDEPAVFAAHIRNLATSHRRYRLVSEKGVAGSKRYTWDSVAGQIESVYREVLAQSGR